MLAVRTVAINCFNHHVARWSLQALPERETGEIALLSPPPFSPAPFPFLRRPRHRYHVRASEPCDRISNPVSSARLAFVRVRLCNGPARQKREKRAKKKKKNHKNSPTPSIDPPPCGSRQHMRTASGGSPPTQNHQISHSSHHASMFS